MLKAEMSSRNTGFQRLAAALQAKGWRPIDEVPYSNFIGPFWRLEGSAPPRFGLIIDERHDNSRKRAHGGLIMTFCDDALGLTAQYHRPQETMFTISFTCQFSGAANFGDFIEMRGEVTRSTRSLMFMHGECTLDGEVIAQATGVWKITKAIE